MFSTTELGQLAALVDEAIRHPERYGDGADWAGIKLKLLAMKMPAAGVAHVRSTAAMSGLGETNG